MTSTHSGRRMIGYVRVSTSEQALSGLGIAAQRTAIQAACTARGMTLVDVAADEGASGKDMDRPGLSEVLRRVAAGEADGIVCSKLDRLARSAFDFLALARWCHDAGVALVVLDMDLDTSTPMGAFVIGVMAQVAELERGLIADRTRQALDVRRQRGQATSRPGVRDTMPAIAVRIAAERAAERTWQAIADDLNAEGVPTVRGGACWRVSSVQAAAGYRRPPARAKAVALPEVPRRRRRVAA